MLKTKTCCFSGTKADNLLYGNDESHPYCVKLKILLALEINKMRKSGVTTFLSGMDPGPSMWYSEIILGMKQSAPGNAVRLIAVLPYEGQANHWSEYYRERYFYILAEVDDVITLQSRYTPDCIYRRNRNLVDSSAHLIAIYNGHRGGTKYTIDYATRNGLDIVLINPDTLQREHR